MKLEIKTINKSIAKVLLENKIKFLRYSVNSDLVKPI